MKNATAPKRPRDPKKPAKRPSNEVKSGVRAGVVLASGRFSAFYHS